MTPVEQIRDSLKLDEEFERLRGTLAEAFSCYSEVEVDGLLDEATEAVRANPVIPVESEDRPRSAVASDSSTG